MFRVTYKVIMSVLIVVMLTACSGGGSTSSSSTSGTTPSSTPSSNDALTAINASYAWNNTATGAGYTVATIDSGANCSHEAFGTRALCSSGYDYGDSDNDPSDAEGHGTAVASIIAGSKASLTGIAYDTMILPVKATSGTSTSATNTAVQSSIDYARVNSANVINMSLGYIVDPTPAANDAAWAALKNAVTAGILIVNAAGNSGSSDPQSPGRYAANTDMNGQLITVGAVQYNSTTKSYEIWPSSNKAGTTAKDFYMVAPGVNVRGAWIGSTSSYATVTGTSFAAPYVTGAALVIKDKYPALTVKQIARALLDSATDLGAPGVDAVYGHGMLNIKAALQLAATY